MKTPGRPALGRIVVMTAAVQNRVQVGRDGTGASDMQLVGMLDSPYVRRVAVALIAPGSRSNTGRSRSSATSTSSPSSTRS
jgi:hypothetical protein